MSNIKLNIDKTSLFVGDKEIKVGESVDFMSADPFAKPSMGKILEFKYAGFKQSDQTSIWMNIKDLQEEKETEWISVNNWARDFYKQKQDERNQPEADTDLPF